MSLVIKWHEAAIREELNSIDGPVGRFILQVSEEAAVIAREAVRVRNPGTRDRRRRAGVNSTASPPGYTRANIRTHIARGSLGGLYGGVNAPGNPGLFLEYPAEQMDRKYPFLTTALDAIVARYQ